MLLSPRRGEIWRVDLSPTLGREQRGERPALVLSAASFNASAAELIVVLPLTSRDKSIRSHVQIDPPEGGLSMRSFVKCEDIRSISTLRLAKRLGEVSDSTLFEVEVRVRILLGLLT